MSLSGPAPGWYGKIASLGDFAGRRLPPEFVTAVDHWLQRVIPESRQHLGDGWMDAYLTSPVWRFVLFPSVIGAGAWAGILMPSVDKVGRYFPLLITAGLERLPGALDDWLARLEGIALTTLDTACTPEDLEARLLACPAPESDLGGCTLLRALGADSPGTMALPPDTGFNALLTAAAMATLSTTARGRSLWWAPAHQDGQVAVIAATGLPDGPTFATLLQGGPAPAPFESALHATPP